jgi:hypothetical protein
MFCRAASIVDRRVKLFYESKELDDQIKIKDVNYKPETSIVAILETNEQPVFMPTKIDENEKVRIKNIILECPRRKVISAICRKMFSVQSVDPLIGSYSEFLFNQIGLSETEYHEAKRKYRLTKNKKPLDLVYKSLENDVKDFMFEDQNSNSDEEVMNENDFNSISVLNYYHRKSQDSIDVYIDCGKDLGKAINVSKKNLN